MPKEYVPWIAAFAFTGGVLAWATALAALATWAGLDPEAVGTRVLGTACGAFFGLHVWKLAAKQVTDPPSLVFYPAKLALAVGLACVSTFAATRFISLTVSVLLFGSGEGLSPGVELLLLFTIGVVAIGYFEAEVFRSDLTVPVSSLAAIIGSSLRLLPNGKQLAQRLGQSWRDHRRRVRRRHDPARVQSAEEARRRAERLL